MKTLTLKMMIREKSDDQLCKKMAIKLSREFDLEDVALGTETELYIKSKSPSEIYCFGEKPLRLVLRMMKLKHKEIDALRKEKDAFHFSKADGSILTVYQMPAIHNILKGGKQELARTVSILQDSPEKSNV